MSEQEITHIDDPNEEYRALLELFARAPEKELRNEKQRRSYNDEILEKIKKLHPNREFKNFKSKWLLWNQRLIIDGRTEDGIVVALRPGVPAKKNEPITVQVIISSFDTPLKLYTLLTINRCYLVDYNPDYEFFTSEIE